VLSVGRAENSRYSVLFYLCGWIACSCVLEIRVGPGDLSGVNMEREIIRDPDYRLVCTVVHEAAWLLCIRI
jgi:hypothetical protein